MPGALFDAPIFYPAPNQLASTEHLLTYQAIYLPLVGIFRNELLATNLLVFATYPLAAILMYRFQLSLGIWSGAAWIGGLAFALSGERVPASFQILQYGNFFLPLLGLAVHYLWKLPTLRSVGLLFLAYLGALFSSYYLGVIATLTVALLAIFELIIRGDNRLRRMSWLSGVIVIGFTILLVFSRPYLRHDALNVGASYSESQAVSEEWSVAPAESSGAGRVAGPFLLETLLPAVPISALAGLGALAAFQRRFRPFAILGYSLIATSAILVTGHGLRQVVHWFPYLAFLRSPNRFRVIGFFGFSLLAGTGLNALRALVPSLAAPSVAIAAIALCADPGRDLVPAMDEIAAYGSDAAVYGAVERITSRNGTGGALLEVPPIATGLRDHSPDAMVGSIRHRLPLVAGYAGYDPPQKAFYLRLFPQLPNEEVLGDLIDLTHLRWLLVRPTGAWPSPEARVRYLRELDASPSVGASYHLGDWELRRLDRVPAHGSWFDAINHGARPGQSVLGSPLISLPRIEGSLEVPSEDVEEMMAGSARWVAVRLSNGGDVPWPVVTRGDVPLPAQMYLQLTWMAGARPVARAEAQVRRDLPPKESLTQPILLVAPPVAGDYDVRVEIAQRPVDGRSPNPLSAVLKVRVKDKTS